jgi:hypothetical protein
MLLANLDSGFHEQRRLQLEIAAALDAAIIDPDHLKSRILEALLPRLSPFRRLRLFIRGLLGWKSPLDRAGERLAERLTGISHHVITECLMS